MHALCELNLSENCCIRPTFIQVYTFILYFVVAVVWNSDSYTSTLCQNNLYMRNLLAYGWFFWNSFAPANLSNTSFRQVNNQFCLKISPTIAKLLMGWLLHAAKYILEDQCPKTYINLSHTTCIFHYRSLKLPLVGPLPFKLMMRLLYGAMVNVFVDRRTYCLRITAISRIRRCPLLWHRNSKVDAGYQTLGPCRPM